MKLLKNIPLIFALLMLLVLLGYQISQNTRVKSNTYIENGVLDLSDWGSNKGENIKLDGQWEFYWQKLLTYNDLHGSSLMPDLMAGVPNV